MSEDNVIPFKKKEEEPSLTPFSTDDIDALQGMQFAMLSLLTMLGIFLLNTSTLSAKLKERDPDLERDLKELAITIIKIMASYKVLLITATVNRPK